MKDINIPHPNLTTHECIPENQESPLQALKEWITPIENFYLRNHFPYPQLNDFFSLSIEGLVDKQVVFTLQDLKNMPSKNLLIPLECAGNKRAFFNPKVFDTQWKDGAMSQGFWTGVSLRHLLEEAGVKKNNTEVIFEAHDYGHRKDIPGLFRYSRSLPLEKALHRDVLVAYSLNGKDIPFKHGYPLRLVVPQWYGMAWVKWLKRIILTYRRFNGPFQVIDYQYYPDKETDLGKYPVTYQNINSTILEPLNHSIINGSKVLIEGIAWTGKGTVQKVELSFNKGLTWHNAPIYRYPQQAYSWVKWKYQWNVGMKGEYIILSKAIDSEGRVQPLEGYWNRKGYGYNAVSKVKVKVV